MGTEPPPTEPAGAPTTGVGRRQVLRVAGVGATGLGLGGLGALAACSSDKARSTAGAAAATPANRSPQASTTTTKTTPAYDPDQPYWEQGNFAAVTQEETLTDLRVNGSLPPELTGLFVRNGSNPPDGKALHWFLGDGMVHGVRLERGKASWYRNRYVSTPIHAAGKDSLTFGGIPGKANNQSNVALVHHAGKLLTTGEVGWPFQLDISDLSTVGPWSFAGKLGNTMTAHPKVDPITGRMHFFGYEIVSPTITYYAADPQGKIDVVSPIELDNASMVHDFAVTDRDAIFWLGPVVFGPDAKNPLPAVPFHWDPAGRSRVGVMALDGRGDQIRWVDIPTCFVFHGLNAHREGDDIVLRVHKLPEAFGRKGDLVPSHLTEWRIGTAGDRLTFAEKRLSDRVMDLPTHDRRHTGRPTRHGWCATTVAATSTYGFELAGICHVDLQTGEEDVWQPGPNRRSGEGFFVPAGKAEGEGWVLTFVWDRRTNRSSLAVFDAQAMRRGPVAEVELPMRVPFGFHGLWVDEADL
ncbi:MAG: carotenoid oxygenase family protein [Acidimicrobiales bacterium]